MIHIYNKQASHIISLNGDIKDFMINPTKYYPDWDIKNNIATEIEYKNPIIKNGIIREKDNYELYLEGKYKLVDGEVISNGEIEYIPKPQGYKIEWINSEWVETITDEELAEILKSEIISTTTKLTEIRNAGFNDKILENKLIELRQKHLETTHAIATN